MLPRSISRKRFHLPRGIVLPECPALMLEHLYHTPGQAAAIRFFDPYSKPDHAAMQMILKGKQVQKWMDDAHIISRREYEEWAGTTSKTSFLFAVLDARSSDLKTLNQIRGFVYIYSEREEKFRVKRMEKQGFLKIKKGEHYYLEISFAVKPLVRGQQSGSGLMSSAIRQSCLAVMTLLNSPTKPEIHIFGFVDPGNAAARRTLEAAGFRLKGLMKYDTDSPEKTCLYFLSWRILQRKVRKQLLELQP